jgi:pteridine reductase
VTGASSPIGRAIALRLAREGWDLALHYRSSRRAARALALELGSAGARTALYVLDLAHSDRAGSLVRRVVRDLGRLDLLVNNASLFRPSPEGVRSVEWDRFFRVNAVTPYRLARSAAPHLRRWGGSVVNLVDIYAEHPVLEGYAPYLASKAALGALTKVLARELAPEVRVNAVSPGAVTFPGSYGPSQRRAVASRSLLGRAGEPEDVAGAVAYLATARFTTGQTLAVDGGRFL